MTIQCPYCKALRFPREKLNCCHNERVCLPTLSPYPSMLSNHMKGATRQSKSFLKNIRHYNSSFAFALMAPPPGRGPCCFCIRGQLYHRTGTLYPEQRKQPQFGHLHILDGHEATSTRLNQHPECDKNTMNQIQNVLNKHSPYAAAYRHMHQVEQAQAQESHTEPPTVKLTFKHGKDQWRYNLPSVDEVCAFFVGDDGMPPAQRDFVVYPQYRPVQNIHYLSATIDHMMYPLLFP